MTDPRMTTGLEMLSSDQPSSEQSAESRAAPQWSLRSLMSLRSVISPHSHALTLSGWATHHWTGSCPSCLRLSLLSPSLTHSSQLSLLSLTKTRGSWCLVSLRTQLQPPEPSLQPLPSPGPAACGHSAKGSVRPTQLSTRAHHPHPVAGFKILHTWQ